MDERHLEEKIAELRKLFMERYLEIDQHVTSSESQLLSYLADAEKLLKQIQMIISAEKH